MTSTTGAVEWGMAACPAPGENILGDQALVTSGDQHALAAAVDGIGHGAEAAAAARDASRVIERSAEQDVASAARECHRALQHTRGAAVSLASIDCRQSALTWVGIGNVEGRLLRGAQPMPLVESLLLHSGIVGHDLPQLRPQTMALARGDVLIFATDGIRRDFADILAPSGSCRQIAHRILQQYATGSDDALVLVVRYLGSR